MALFCFFFAFNRICMQVIMCIRAYNPNSLPKNPPIPFHSLSMERNLSYGKNIHPLRRLTWKSIGQGCAFLTLYYQKRFYSFFKLVSFSLMELKKKNKIFCFFVALNVTPKYLYISQRVYIYKKKFNFFFSKYKN